MIPDSAPTPTPLRLSLTNSDEMVQENIKLLADLADVGTMDPRRFQAECVSQPVSPVEGRRSEATGRLLLYNSCVQVAREGTENCGTRSANCIYDYELSHERPCLSYVDMIRSALLSSRTGRMKLGEIYAWIAMHYPYFQTSKLSWRNSVRHALSASREFCRVLDGPAWCRGGEWQLKERIKASRGAVTRKRAKLMRIGSAEPPVVPPVEPTISAVGQDDAFRKLSLSMDFEDAQYFPLGGSFGDDTTVDTQSRCASDPFKPSYSDSLAATQTPSDIDTKEITVSSMDMPDIELFGGNMCDLVICDGLVKRRSMPSLI